MGAASVEIGSAPSIARHLAFVIPAGDRERVWPVFAGRAVRLDDAQCMMLDATALSILPIMMAPLLGGAFALLSVQLARGCLEGVLQPRVLSVPASAVVGLRQTGQRLTSIPIPALMDGIPDRMRSPRIVGSPCTVIDAQMDRLIARFVVQHADRGPTVRIRLSPALSPSQRGPADAVANLGGGHAGTVKPHPVVGSCVGCGSESDRAPDASLPWVRRGCERA